MTKRVILLTVFKGAFLDRLCRLFTPHADVVVAADRAALDRYVGDGKTSTLVCFGTGVIVPEAQLKLLGRPSYNVHAASPQYPGRDPHHFAAYDGAGVYGATLHLMTASVDAGPIVDMEEFAVDASWPPSELLARANDAGLRLLERYAAQLVGGVAPLSSTLKWTGKKRSRQDFLAACKLDLAVSEDEFARRFFAFDGGAYDNLTVELHGWTFRIDKSIGKRN